MNIAAVRKLAQEPRLDLDQRDGPRMKARHGGKVAILFGGIEREINAPPKVGEVQQ